MAVLDVVTYGHPILREKAKSVEDFSELYPLVEDMFDTMYEQEGIGLAANQVGIGLNVMVVDLTHLPDWEMPFVFVNGKILESRGESVMEEGCLSLPEIRVEVARPETIKFSYQDATGKRSENEFGGLMARVIQHEMDHSNGILMIDRISPLKLQQYKKQLQELSSSLQRRPARISAGIVL